MGNDCFRDSHSRRVINFSLEHRKGSQHLNVGILLKSIVTNPTVLFIKPTMSPFSIIGLDSHFKA